MLQMTFDNDPPAGLRDIHVWKCGRTDGRTPARVPSYALLYIITQHARRQTISTVYFAFHFFLSVHNSYSNGIQNSNNYAVARFGIRGLIARRRCQQIMLSFSIIAKISLKNILFEHLN